MIKSMEEIVRNQREFFNDDKTKPLLFRKTMLTKLKNAIEQNEELLYSALKADLNKSKTEAYLTEIQIVYEELKSALNNLARWQKPKRVKTPITHFPAASHVYYEPYGVVMILSPWNYPFQLAIAPLIGAIAAGNCAVMKVSKSSMHTSKVIEKIINETFNEHFVYCVSEEYSYSEILEQHYDFIFFTGSERVGKTVMESAAKHVTPLVLELGGKSPCIIEKSADITLAAKRVAWGKFLNSGQTCVAPDYVLVDEAVKSQFISALDLQITKMYGNALKNDDYPKIINKHHFDRLKKLISDEENKIGGKSDEIEKKIAPTIFFNAGFNDDVMAEEIFGPILPIISYKEISEVTAMLKSRAKPLAFYLFSENKAVIEKLINSIPFGGGCINDVIMHLANHFLPFGGVGSSGMGSYHGKYSFMTFSHQKAILKNKSYFDVPLRYPPYTKGKLKLIKKLMK